MPYKNSEKRKQKSKEYYYKHKKERLEYQKLNKDKAKKTNEANELRKEKLLAMRMAAKREVDEYNEALRKERECREKRKQKIKSLLNGQPCTKCGETDIDKLCFHHVDKTTKLFDVGPGGKSWDKILEEVKKCIVMCRKCHSGMHAKERHEEWRRKHGNAILEGAGI
jgi:hypothetical protein